MQKNDFFYLGKIIRTHGNKGHLLVFLDVDDPGDYSKIETVYLDLHGERVPYFISELEIRQNRKGVLRFEGIDSIEEAEVFCGLSMSLPLSHLPELEDKQFYFHEIIGFSVIDIHRGFIGIIAGVLELPYQSLLRIMNNDKEILVPAVDDIITCVNRDKKEIQIEAPEGLIDLYL